LTIDTNATSRTVTEGSRFGIGSPLVVPEDFVSSARSVRSAEQPAPNAHAQTKPIAAIAVMGKFRLMARRLRFFQTPSQSNYESIELRKPRPTSRGFTK
jgi:hypothetical protein